MTIAVVLSPKLVDQVQEATDLITTVIEDANSTSVLAGKFELTFQGVKDVVNKGMHCTCRDMSYVDVLSFLRALDTTVVLSALPCKQTHALDKKVAKKNMVHMSVTGLLIYLRALFHPSGK